MRRGPRLARTLLLAALLAVRAGAAWAQSTLNLSGSALWTNAVDVEILGETAYCPVPEGLLILDIQDAFDPAVRSFAISPDSTVVRAAFRGTTVYMSMGTAGAAVFDGADPDSARFLARVPSRGSSVIGIAGRDSLVFTTEGDWLYTHVLGPDSVAAFKSELRVPVVAKGLEWAGQTLVLFGASGAVTFQIVSGGPVPADTLLDPDTLLASAGNASYLYAATQQSHEVVVFSADGGGAYTEDGRFPVAGNVSDMDLTSEFLAVATDSGFGVYLLTDPLNPELVLDRFDGVPVAALGLEGRTLAAVRDAKRCEFYTVAQPLDLANIQNVPGRGAFLHADFANGHLYVASQDSGTFRYPASPGPQLGARTEISPDGTRSVAASDTVLVAGHPSVGVLVYSGPVGGSLALRDTVPPAAAFVDADVRGDLAAVANRTLGVRIIGVADPDSAPILSSYKPLGVILDAIRAEFVDDTLLYVLNKSISTTKPGLHVVDLSDPAAPESLRVIPQTLVEDLSIDVANDRMVLLHGPPGGRSATLFDISNPASPAPRDTVSVPDGNHVAIKAQTLLVTKDGGGFYRVIVSGGTLTAAGEGTTIAPATWAVAGPQAFYVLEGSSGIQVFESSGAMNLVPLGQFEFGGNLVAIATHDSTIVVGDDVGTVTTLRLSPAGTIAAVDRMDLSAGIRTIGFLGDSLCAVVSDDSLHLLGVAETGEVDQVGAMVSPPGFLINAIAFSGSYLYMGGGQDVFVVDVSSPANPNLVNYFDTRGPSDPERHGNLRSIVVVDSTLFAIQRGNLTTGLTPLITAWRLDPSSTLPQFLGRFEGEEGIEYLDAVGDHARLYVGQGNDGVGVFSVEDPAQISKTGDISGLLGVESVTIVGGFLVTANGTSGIAGLDIATNPVTPPVVALVETPGRARTVAALPEFILVADTGALLVYSTEIIIEDVLPPVLALGLIPNPFITAYADLYVVSDERLAETPTVHFLVADLDSFLTMAPIGAAGRVYHSRLTLSRVGPGLFEIGGCDIFTNCVLGSREVVFDSLRGAPGGTVSMDSGGFKAAIDPGSFSGAARLLAIRYREEDLPAAGWGGGLPEGGSSSGYQLSILDPVAVPLKLSFRPPGDGPPTSWQAYQRRPTGWAPLETRYDGVSLEAVSDGDGLFWLGRGVALDTSGLPREAVLHQNAPNPFNPSTLIRYDVPMPGARVRVAIFSVEGRLVREIASGFQDAGRREAFWDGRDDAGGDVASGIYFLRYEAGPRVLTRKITLLR